MRRKLGSRRGLTLVEMMAAAVILILLGLMLHTGLLLARQSYDDMRAESETQLLLSTAADLLSNELRYARRVAVDGENRLVRYTSVNYGRYTTLSLDGDGRLEAGSRQMLPVGAYSNGDCRIEMCQITYDARSSIFQVSLRASGPGEISNETQFSVRCLNAAEEAGGNE